MNFEPLDIRDRGGRVRLFQKFLIANDFDLGPYGADGDYYNLTMLATMRFQEKFLRAVRIGPVDGVVRETLWRLAGDHGFGRLGGDLGEMLRPAVEVEPHSIGEGHKFLGRRGYEFIRDMESGGRAYYEKVYGKPHWPKYESGITIGFGWDLRFNTVEKFREVWVPVMRPFWSAGMVERLEGVSGLKGSKAMAGELSDIPVPWRQAEAVFCEDTLPRFWALTRNVFPGIEGCHPHVQAALLSLVFNRGTRMTGHRRRYMRRIRELVSERDYEGIAQCLRDMLRWWEHTGIAQGMKRRRYGEADLVISALA